MSRSLPKVNSGVPQNASDRQRYAPAQLRTLRSDSLVAVLSEGAGVTFVQHSSVDWERGYYSKLWSRRLLDSRQGATESVVWEQVLPPEGLHHAPFPQVR
jgi:hypothetical protein